MITQRMPIVARPAPYRELSNMKARQGPRRCQQGKVINLCRRGSDCRLAVTFALVPIPPHIWVSVEMQDCKNLYIMSFSDEVDPVWEATEESATNVTGQPWELCGLSSIRWNT